MCNLLIGDSHCKWMNVNNCEEFICGAGSAKGLNNKNSISNYHNIIIEKVKTPNIFYKNLIFMFGGVDMDFCYIHKYVENQDLNIYDFIDPVIHNYVNFLVENFSHKRVIVLSAGLPTLDDENLKCGLLNGHINALESKDPEELKCRLNNISLPDIYTRTLNTIIMNFHLKDIIEKKNNPNLIFLDVTTFTYDENKKIIKDEFFTRVDHHNYSRNENIRKLINSSL